MAEKIPEETRAKIPLLDKAIPCANQIVSGFVVLLVVVFIACSGGGKSGSSGRSSAASGESDSSDAVAEVKGAFGDAVGALKDAAKTAAGSSSSEPAKDAKSAPKGKPEPGENFEVALLKDGTVQIKKYTGKNKDLVIPDTIQGKPVTYLGDDINVDFPNSIAPGCSSVYIPEGVTTIGERAFAYTAIMGKGNLTSVTLPSTLKTIGPGAFMAQKLKSVSLPDGVKIGITPGSEQGSTFLGCSNLTSVKWPAGMKVIPVEMFSSCGFETLEIPEGVTTIRQDAFKYCSNLTSVKLPSTIKLIEGEAFRDCSKLKTVIIPDTVSGLRVEDIGSPSGLVSPFRGCKLLDLDSQEKLRKFGWSGQI
jgi:hypothetical protein